MKIVKWILSIILVIPMVYIMVACILTAITIDKVDQSTVANKTIFLTTNGVHLDVVLMKKDIDDQLLKGVKKLETTNYIAFGWGDENFYLNTPTWGDLTFGNAFQAIFLKSPTLMHFTRYVQKRNNWVEIKINETELKELNKHIMNTFKYDENGNKTNLKNKGYTSRDDFYRATGSYSCFNTCNSWINTGFKKSGLKACYWTPFDFGLIKKYVKQEPSPRELI